MSEQLTQQHIHFLRTKALNVPRDERGRMCISRQTLEDLGFDLTGINIKAKEERFDDRKQKLLDFDDILQLFK